MVPPISQVRRRAVSGWRAATKFGMSPSVWITKTGALRSVRIRAGDGTGIVIKRSERDRADAFHVVVMKVLMPDKTLSDQS